MKPLIEQIKQCHTEAPLYTAGGGEGPGVRYPGKTAIAVLLFITLLLTSCTKGFQELNTNPNTIPTAQAQQLLAPALVSAVTTNMMRNRNFNNELMQVTVNQSDADGQVFRYDYKSNWSDYLYNGLYTGLSNFKDVYRASKDSGTAAYNRSYMGISLVCQSWLYSILTDTYGDVPYFQSNLARDSGIYEPAFNRQKDIYLDIFNRLEQANELFKTNTAIVASSDPVFAGNVGLWRKFGNSLYLRLLLRLSGKAEVSTAAIAKIKEIAETNTSNYPIISSNAESAILKWTGVAPYTSPYQTVREQDFRAPGLASFFIDNLVAWQDPRIDIPTYGSNGINRWGIAPYSGLFAGIPGGYAPGSNPLKKSYFYSNTSTTSLQIDPLTGMIMNYSEVQLILAEAALKGWISSSPETYYNTGVQAGLTLWLPTYTVPIATYLANADIQWLPNLTFDQKMERIHLQKYYALFLTDMQQWFEYRRTSHPYLPQGVGLQNGGVMPARMVYPLYVQSTNPTNYRLAVQAQGADVISTQVWWQKP